MRRAVWTLVAGMMLAGCSRPSPELQVILDAAGALGGANRIQAVRKLTMEGGGRDLAVGGSVTPSSPPNVNLVTEYRRAIEFANPRVRTQQVRTAQYPFALAVVVRQEQGLDGDVAYNVVTGQATGAAPQAQRASEEVARDRRRERLQHPLTVVRAALDPAATITNLRTEGNQPHVDIALAGGDVATLGVDPATKLPTHVSWRAYDPNWGDIVIDAQFSDYEEVAGLKLPKRIVTKQDQWTTSERQITRNVIDGDAGDLEAPEAARSVAAPVPQPPDVTVEEVGKGIWWLAGSSHRSVVFEFDDHLVLFEVPLNEARTKAVIDKARSLRPGKPLTHAIVSHHHLDHSGGFRTAVAEGLTIITHESNVAFFKEMASRRHTIQQDALAKNPKPVTFELVGDEMTLKDATNEVHLYHVTTTHMDTAVYAYVPRDRMVIQADLFDNGWLWQPWGDTFLKSLATRKLRVDKHVPVHGPIQTHAEVLKTLKEKPKGPPGAATS